MTENLKKITAYNNFITDNSDILKHLYPGAYVYRIRGNYYNACTVISINFNIESLTSDTPKVVLRIELLNWTCNTFTQVIAVVKNKILKIGEPDTVPIDELVFSEKEAINLCIKACKEVLVEYEKEAKDTRYKIKQLNEKLKEFK